MTKTAPLVLSTLIASGLLVAGGPSATASGGDDGRVVNQGQCSGAASWKVKAKPDDGRLEVEGEVDSNQAGQRWSWTIKRDGAAVASGTATTGGRSGSFSVERKIGNPQGENKITFRAERRGGGQTCQGSVTI